MPATLQPSAPAVLRLSMDCRIDKVRGISCLTRQFLVQEEVPARDAEACELVVAEACNNAVLYATGEGRRQPVQVEIACGPDEIAIEVRDHTPGFEFPDTVDLPPEGAERGRGLFLIKTLMDGVEYARGYGENRLCLRRRRAGSEPFAAPAWDNGGAAAARLQEMEKVIDAMAEELSSCYESLAAIFRSGAELGKTDSIEQFSSYLCNDLVRITAGDWFVLRVASRDGMRLELLAAPPAVAGFVAAPLDMANAGITSVEMQAAASRKDIWFDRLAPLGESDPLGAPAENCAGLVHPFYFAGCLMGTLTVGKAAGRPPFTAAQANVIQTFADFLAIQITNSRLRQEQLRSRLMSHELEIARGIQAALIPTRLPELPGLAIAGHCASAEQVGGDFYDVVQVGSDSLLVVIADVMGKGIPAALFAASLRSLVRAAPELAPEPAALLSRINRLLFDELSSVEMFVTVQLAFVEPASRRLTVASAGHCPLLWNDARDRSIRRITPEGMPIGILPEAMFHNKACRLPAGARVMLYSDGLTDARNSKGEFFGERRLVEWLEGTAVGSGAPAPVLREALLEALGAFRQQTPLFDDETFIILTTPAETKDS